MATRTFFIIHPGLPAPTQFRPQPVELLTQQDIWEHARAVPPSLLFRVRSESDPGAQLSPKDRLESCVGVIDAHTRWRTVFALTRGPLQALRSPALRQACSEAMTLISTTHPAAIPLEQRQAVAGTLMLLADPQDEKAPKPHPFEARVASYVAGLVQCDNDIEAAAMVPFASALCPFSEENERARFAERMATVETLTGSALLIEAFNRLSERAPVWLLSQMPALQEAKESEEDDQGDDED